jgi:hypothetical protein
MEALYWKKAYIMALENSIGIKNPANLSANAKAAATHYIADYKVRKDVPEFKANRSLWGHAYFAVIGKIAPEHCGDIADVAVNDFEAFSSSKKS